MCAQPYISTSAKENARVVKKTAHCEVEMSILFLPPPSHKHVTSHCAITYILQDGGVTADVFSPPSTPFTFLIILLSHYARPVASPAFKNPSSFVEACLHRSECVCVCVFILLRGLLSAGSIDRWSHFLLRIDCNSLSLTCVWHLCMVALE